MKWLASDPTARCLNQTPAGIPYEELSCLYPTLGKTYTTFETTFVPNYIHKWMVEHPAVPVFAVTLYAVLIFLGRTYFRNREAWNWRVAMAFWNLFLSVFSAIGFARAFPALVHTWTHYNIEENFCFDPESHFASGSTGLWVLAFVLSKFPELFDTFFIVIHKKPLIFLHWYHHISVLLYCWHSYVNRAPHGIIFVVMNYAVHAIMYFYYFLMAAKCKPKAFNAVYITMAQISQMIVGVAVTITGCYFLWFDKSFSKECHLSTDNNIAALLMYGSYLFLFMEFFLKRYIGGKKKKTKMKNGIANGSHKKVN